MSDEITTHLGCLVVRTVCGKAGKSIQREIEGWISHNGKEWTCQRLKSIWNAALHLRNGDPDSAVKLYQETSIAYHKASSVPKGPMGYVVKQFLKARRPSVLRKYAAVMRFYTSLRLDRVTPRQRKKYESAITTGRQHWNDEVYTGSVKLATKLLRQRLKASGYSQDTFSRFWKQFDYDPFRLSGSSYYFCDKKIPRDLRKLPYGHFVWSFMNNLRCPEELGSRMYNHVDINLIMMDLGAWVGDQHFGRIQVLQEQGCKARVVFQPNARVQLCFYPLHKFLAKLNRVLFPESCVEDQVSGVYLALENLEAGNDIHSVDLSSATDRFPRKFSLEILRDLGCDEHARALEQICYEAMPCADSDKDLRYEVGQPMGLYGSFPLFNLSNLLVAACAQDIAERHIKSTDKLIRFRGGSTFSILGDDIILSDERVAKTYRNLMFNLGCDISLSKTFSGKVGEFAGFVFAPTSEGKYTAFRPYKVPEGTKITNPLEFLHGLGSSAKKVSPYWERMFEAYSKTLGMRDLSLTPLVGDDHPTVDFNVSSQWMNALTNRVLMSDGIDVNDDPDIPVVREIFRSPQYTHQPMSLDTYFSLDQMVKARRRHRMHGLKDDPLIREYIQELGLREPSSKRSAKQGTVR